MKTKSVIKKLTIYTSMIPLLFVLNSSSIRKRSKEFFHDTTKISKHKIEYNNGTIYIGSKSYLKTIKNLSDNDILALDARRSKDPNIQIYDSYKITDDLIMEEIIESLLLYEEKYPTEWERTKNTMIREWLAHNAMHRVGYEVDRTENVDFNNEDEETYRIRK